jgi:2-polyprenyl-6-methoxyphenol hydroxylase-like FAD-dependent oxidoreductase
MTQTKMGEHALVMGAGVAGLVTAHILAERFERVTIIDRDQLPDTPQIRSGTPQARHFHLLLLKGKAILDEMFPGFVAELIASGAVAFDFANYARIYSVDGWYLRMPSDYTVLGCSRALLEWTLRSRVAATANIRFAPLTEVLSLTTDSEPRRVTGARVRLRQTETHTLGAEEDWKADLVVDATGRHSRAPQWLEALGYAPPQETMINGFAGYASRIYEPPANWQADWKIIAILTAFPRIKRGGVVAVIDGGRWFVSLTGFGKDCPPTDEEGFLAFAKSLPVPDVYEAISQATPLSDIAAYRQMENRWRHFERLERMPEGFLVMGDALCAFNPIYGQGMTVATQSALALKAILSQLPPGDLTDLGKRAQRAFANACVTPWSLATAEDLRNPDALGKRPGPLTQALYWYADAFRTLLPYDSTALRAFYEVTHLVTPPTAMFQPRLVLDVLSKQARKRFAQTGD